MYKITIEENLNILANRIFKEGALHNGDGCLQPSVFHRGHNDDAIIDTYNVTHYDRIWEEFGKSVKIKFYKAKAFGDSLPDLNNIIFESVVEI